MSRPATDLSEYLPKILIVGIYAPYNTTTNLDSYFEEFVNLVTSRGLDYEEAVFIKIRQINAATFITKGKLEELAELCKKKGIGQVIVSEPLSPQQERNLSDYLGCAVFDRTHLILEIFENNAHSAEGKLQVKIAILNYQKSRMSGKGVHLSQQAGFFGMRGGFGETAKEKEKRHIEDEILKIKSQLKKLQQTRETQRKQRLDTNLPHVSLIGYTNAGKSTILNALTKSDVLAEDRLFATLDTTTRQLIIDGQKKGLISDTVGFIQLLPHQLIEAFKSTLSELKYAHLLLQVIDISDSNWEEHIKVVHQILDELEVEKPMLYIFNKADKIEITPALLGRIKKYQPYVVVSALTSEGLQPLLSFLAQLKK